MRTRITLLLVGLMGLSLNTFAQSETGRIKGMVKDTEGAALAFANVILNLGQDSSVAKVGYTDDDGLFEIVNVPAGNYWVTVSYVGLPEQKSDLFEVSPGAIYELPTMELKPQAEELDAVTITAERPMLEVRPDKTVFNVDGSVNAVGSSALELLRKAPGIVIDNNDNVSMLGRAGVQIYIDGKPSPLTGADLANFLRSMNSTEIDAIELISNPSAKYDAAGNAGIINIKLKKDKSLGANGSLNLGAGQGRATRYNTSINGNFRDKKINLFGNYSFNDGGNPQKMNLYREQFGFVLDQRGDQDNQWRSNNFKAGVDYFINPKHTIGVMVNGNVNQSEFNNVSETLISMVGSNSIDSILVAESMADGNRNNFNYNLNYVFNGDNSTVNFDLDYGMFRNESEAFQPNYYRDPTGEITLSERINQFDTPTDIDIYTAKLDYETDFMNGKLGLGAKSAIVRTDNTFDFFDVISGTPILNTDRSNQFEYTENVNAAYANYARQFEKFGFSLGLRMEQTNSTGELTSFVQTNDETVKRSYLDFFPSGGFTYTPNQNHNFQFNFSRRINRPSYQDLNPFEQKLDELTFQKGNPFLNPEYAMNVKLTHTFKYRFNTTFSYSHTTDLITRIVDTQGETSTFITWRNMAEQRNYSLSFSAPIPITKWWSSYTNITGYHVINQGDYGADKIVNLSATAMNLYTQHTFTLPKDWKLELSSWYNSPSIWEGTFEMESQYSIDAGVSKSIMNGRANIKLSVSDIFRTTPFSGASQFGPLFMTVNGDWDSRRVSLNLNYRFGNNQVKSSRRRKTGMEDESSRIKG
jgi:outer membrane receptor protein involved in Fe transport